ncbi:hypothetical protein TanjilG_07584 [Lupinus angustifolius]|uniref:glucan endo-1,3-beta-D-glucosidase n=1 Tax=Lupinus angustifolius TaxID=3871 RepID=A0A1J7GDX8_LUPAN|nr:hypothetical protein TanjilG_07584 [Lupinus angustifolius]
MASTLKGLVLLLVLTLIQGGGGQGIGVNYGTIANNLPPPPQVAKFLLHSTIISRVRLFDANPQILQAFAGTGIEVTISVPNDEIPHITNLSIAQQWVNTNVQPFIHSTNLIMILVGNEVLSTANKLLITNLVPAMQTLHAALAAASLDNHIKVSTPLSLGILSNTTPPSSAKFRQGYDTHIIKPMLNFLKDTNAPFMVNPYPFFGCTHDDLDYALFQPNAGVFDENTKLLYTNMLDAQLDGVYSAIKVLLGFENKIEIGIAETGWPSVGDPANNNTQLPFPPLLIHDLNSAPQRRRTTLGRSSDPNRGRPWSPHHLSPSATRVLHSLLDPSLRSDQVGPTLQPLFQPQHHPTAASDILAIIKALGFNKKFELALNVFDYVRHREGCASLLNGSSIAVIINILGKANKVSSAASLLLTLQNDGIQIDVYAYTSLITAYATNGRYREAVNVFNKMQQEGCTPTLITFNVILNVYGKMGMPWSKIIALVDAMKRDGVPPDLYTYNTLISCCRRGSLYEEAVQLFDEMKLAGFRPDKVTYNALLDVFGKSRKPKEAMQVLREMESNGFSPTIVTFNSLISAYARGGLLEEALNLKTQMMEKGIRPDVFTYTTLLSGFDKAGKDEFAMNVFEEMRAAGCKPNICTFNALIKMHGNRGKFVEMMKVFEEIKVCNCSPDIVTWNTLLAVFGQNGMDSEVSGVFKEMKRAGFVPERDTFNTLISAYSRCGSFDQAIGVYKSMLEAGVAPDLSTYNAVLAALARGGLWEQSEKVLAEMKDGRCKPNELTYSSLLHAYANGKQIERMNAFAEEIYSGSIETHAVLLKTLVLVNSKTDLLMETERAFLELRRRGISPDITTLNAMISIYGRKQMLAKTNEILNFMYESGFTPTLTTYNSLMYMYSRSENFQKSEEVLREILEKGMKPDKISYNTVIYAYCRNGRMKEASRIFSEMKDAAALVPDVVTYNTFIATYAADSMFVEAIDVVRYMIKQGCKPNQTTFNSIIDWYCKLNRQDEAKYFVKSLGDIGPHVSKEEESRLLERIAKKWS